MMILLVWLLMAGVAGAGDFVDLNFRTSVMVDNKELRKLIDEADRTGSHLNVFLYEYDEKRDMWDRARPAPCLERMQAAMEAMEPFVPHYWAGFNLPLNGGVRQELSHDEMPRFRGAVALWTEAKACWRKP